ncbi:MAG: hypothetical protein QM499_01070 [Flavobacteriaceae bacterium]
MFNKIREDDSEDGYLMSESDIEDLTKILNPSKPNDRPFYAWLICLERGVIEVDLKQYIPCNNKECKQCSSMSKLLKKII